MRSFLLGATSAVALLSTGPAMTQRLSVSPNPVVVGAAHSANNLEDLAHGPRDCGDAGLGSVAKQAAHSVTAMGGKIDRASLGAATQTPSIAAKNLTQINGGQTITGAFVAENTPFLASAFLTGTPKPSVYGALAPWQINFSDGLSVANTAGSGVNTLQVTDSLRAGVTGSRQAIVGHVLVNAQPAPLKVGQYVAYVGGQFLVSARHGLGGSGGAISPTNYVNKYLGSVFGYNPQVILASGADFYGRVAGAEINVSIASGTGAPSQLFGDTIVHTSGHQVQGLYDDAGLAYSDQDGAAPWRTGIQFGMYGNQWPFNEASTLIGVKARVAPRVATAPALMGIDFNQVTFSSGGFAFRSPGFTVNPSGIIGSRLTTPASSRSSCTPGQFENDTDYHYVCIATDTWKRVALTSF